MFVVSSSAIYSASLWPCNLEDMITIIIDNVLFATPNCSYSVMLLHVAEHECSVIVFYQKLHYAHSAATVINDLAVKCKMTSLISSHCCSGHSNLNARVNTLDYAIIVNTVR